MRFNRLVPRNIGVLVLFSMCGFSLIADDKYNVGEEKTLSKTYSASYKLEIPYEVGKATLTLSADCQELETDGAKAIEAALPKLEKDIKAKFEELDLASSGDLQGYDLSEAVQTQYENPVSTEYKENAWIWKDRCSKKTSDKPFRSDYVYKATKQITIWMPNKETVLTELGKLVTALEAKSSKEPKGVTVKRASNARFALDISPSKEKESNQTILEKSKAAAMSKRDQDFASKNYDDKWPVEESFNAYVDEGQLADAVVTKDKDGKWKAKFASSVSYGVLIEQLSQEAAGGILLRTKNYDVSAEAETEEGLFGQLSVTISQDCLTDQDKSEALVDEKANAILDSARKVIGDKDPETDRIEDAEVQSSDRSPYIDLSDNVKGKRVTGYYNKCTLKVVNSEVEPEDTVVYSSRTITIRSSDLSKLNKFRDDLAKDNVVANADPNKLSVSVSDVKGDVKFDVRDAISAKIEVDADKKFFCDESPYVKDLKDKKVKRVCLSNGERLHGIARRSASRNESVSDAAPERAFRGPTASERGMKVLGGSYRIVYEVRKDLPLPK